MIERTFDYRKVCKLMPCKPIISNDIIYLIDGYGSIWMVEKYNDSLQVHVDMSKKCRGKEALEKCKQVIKWVFDNTDITVLYGLIPKDNRPACHNAVHVGMTFSHETEYRRVYEVAR